MVETIFLRKGETPQDDAYVIIEWRADRTGASVIPEPRGVRYVVGHDKHRFWASEAPHLARRHKLERIYFIGAPDLTARQARPEPPRVPARPLRTRPSFKR